MAGTNYIKRDLHITVKDNISILNESLYLFQNDKNIDLYFTIHDVKFDFLTATQSSENTVKVTNAKYSTIRVLKPNGTKIISDNKLPIEDNKVMFTITEDFIDNLDEVGKYKLQISLYDDQNGKITIPHIEFEVLEPIFPEDFIEEYLMGQIDITKIGMSRIAPETAEASIQEMKNRLADSTGEIQTIIDSNNEQLENGKMFRWNYGDIISSEKMNLINVNIENLWTDLNNLENSLNTKVTELNEKVTKILEAVDTPPTFTKPTLSLSVNKSTIEHNIATSITITPTFRQNDGGAITNYTLMKGATSLVNSTTTQVYTDTITLSHNLSITYTATVYYGDGQNKTSTFGVEYAGLSAGNVSANSTIRAYAPSYYGVIDGTEVTDVTALTSRLGTSKGYTATYNMTNQRSVYMYPKSFGALTSIKDVNNFDYINSYTRSEMIYNNVDYYVYILTDPVEIVGFKQAFS